MSEFTREELQGQFGFAPYGVNDKYLLHAQTELNKEILESDISDELRERITRMNETIRSSYNSTCSACKNIQNSFDDMNVEHMKFKMNWGYESDYDTETHRLTLCCPCYKKFIMDSPLGQFVEVSRYM
jgi:hypothetical protein